MPRKGPGISLLELLVCLAIFCILTVVTLPSVMSLIHKHRLTRTTEKLYIDLQLARSEAVKNNATVYVTFQTGDTWCYGMNVGSACNCTVANNCNLGAVSAPTAQTTSLSISSSFNTGLQFEGTRGAANASGTITFTVYGQSTTKTVTVGRLGGLQIS